MSDQNQDNNAPLSPEDAESKITDVDETPEEEPHQDAPQEEEGSSAEDSVPFDAPAAGLGIESFGVTDVDNPLVAENEDGSVENRVVFVPLFTDGTSWSDEEGLSFSWLGAYSLACGELFGVDFAGGGSVLNTLRNATREEFGALVDQIHRGDDPSEIEHDLVTAVVDDKGTITATHETTRVASRLSEGSRLGRVKPVYPAYGARYTLTGKNPPYRIAIVGSENRSDRLSDEGGEIRDELTRAGMKLREAKAKGDEDLELMARRAFYQIQAFLKVAFPKAIDPTAAGIKPVEGSREGQYFFSALTGGSRKSQAQAEQSEDSGKSSESAAARLRARVA